MPRPRQKSAARGKKPAAGRADRTERAIARLEAEARACEARAVALRASVGAMRGEVAKAGQGGGAGKRGRPSGGGAAGSAAASTTKGRTAKARGERRSAGAGALATEILIEWSRPARAAELLPEIQKRGVLLGGKNPMATLASTLIKYPGVTRVGRGLYAAAPGGVPVRGKPGRKPGRKATPPARKTGRKAGATRG